MSSRNHILELIQKNQPDKIPYPDFLVNHIQYENPVTQFADSLKSVGGSCIFVKTLDELNQQLNSWSHYEKAERRLTLCENIGTTTCPVKADADPHILEDLDFAIIPGELAVAENGAVWIQGRNITIRVIPFITQHLAIVVRMQNVVNNLQEAYEKIPKPHQEFGIFISGPSKTADIEQSLVIGAHGARSLVVFVIE